MEKQTNTSTRSSSKHLTISFDFLLAFSAGLHQAQVLTATTQRGISEW